MLKQLVKGIEGFCKQYQPHDQQINTFKKDTMPKLGSSLNKLAEKRNQDICTYLDQFQGKDLAKAILRMAEKHGVTRMRCYQIRKQYQGVKND